MDGTAPEPGDAAAGDARTVRPPPATDAAGADADRPDARSPDAAAQRDAGPRAPDATASDAGPEAPDAGARDAAPDPAADGDAIAPDGGAPDAAAGDAVTSDAAALDAGARPGRSVTVYDPGAPLDLEVAPGGGPIACGVIDEVGGVEPRDPAPVVACLGPDQLFRRTLQVRFGDAFALDPARDAAITDTPLAIRLPGFASSGRPGAAWRYTRIRASHVDPARDFEVRWSVDQPRAAWDQVVRVAPGLTGLEVELTADMRVHEVPLGEVLHPALGGAAGAADFVSSAVVLHQQGLVRLNQWLPMWPELFSTPVRSLPLLGDTTLFLGGVGLFRDAVTDGPTLFGPDDPGAAGSLHARHRAVPTAERSGVHRVPLGPIDLRRLAYEDAFTARLSIGALSAPGCAASGCSFAVAVPRQVGDPELEYDHTAFRYRCHVVRRAAVVPSSDGDTERAVDRARYRPGQMPVDDRVGQPPIERFSAEITREPVDVADELLFLETSALELDQRGDPLAGPSPCDVACPSCLHDVGLPLVGSPGFVFTCWNNWQSEPTVNRVTLDYGGLFCAGGVTWERNDAYAAALRHPTSICPPPDDPEDPPAALEVTVAPHAGLDLGLVQTAPFEPRDPDAPARRHRAFVTAGGTAVLARQPVEVTVRLVHDGEATPFRIGGATLVPRLAAADKVAVEEADVAWAEVPVAPGAPDVLQVPPFDALEQQIAVDVLFAPDAPVEAVATLRVEATAGGAADQAELALIGRGDEACHVLRERLERVSLTDLESLLENGTFAVELDAEGRRTLDLLTAASQCLDRRAALLATGTDVVGAAVAGFRVARAATAAYLEHEAFARFGSWMSLVGDTCETSVTDAWRDRMREWLVQARDRAIVDLGDPELAAMEDAFASHWTAIRPGLPADPDDSARVIDFALSRHLEGAGPAADVPALRARVESFASIVGLAESAFQVHDDAWDVRDWDHFVFARLFAGVAREIVMLRDYRGPAWDALVDEAANDGASPFSTAAFLETRDRLVRLHAASVAMRAAVSDLRAALLGNADSIEEGPFLARLRAAAIEDPALYETARSFVGGVRRLDAYTEVVEDHMLFSARLLQMLDEHAADCRFLWFNRLVLDRLADDLLAHPLASDLDAPTTFGEVQGATDGFGALTAERDGENLPWFGAGDDPPTRANSVMSVLATPLGREVFQNVPVETRVGAAPGETDRVSRLESYVRVVLFNGFVDRYQAQQEIEALWDGFKLELAITVATTVAMTWVVPGLASAGLRFAAARLAGSRIAAASGFAGSLARAALATLDVYFTADGVREGLGQIDEGEVALGVVRVISELAVFGLPHLGQKLELQVLGIRRLGGEPAGWLVRAAAVLVQPVHLGFQIRTPFGHAVDADDVARAASSGPAEGRPPAGMAALLRTHRLPVLSRMAQRRLELGVNVARSRIEDPFALGQYVNGSMMLRDDLDVVRQGLTDSLSTRASV